MGAVEGNGGHLTDRMRALLHAGYEEGVRTHAVLPLPFERFVARAVALCRARVLRSGREPTEGAVEEVLGKAVLQDVYLAAACDERVPGAWEAFQSRYAPRIRSLALRQGATAAQAEHLAEEMAGALLLPPARGGARTRMGTFDGTGSLVAWLAAIVAHRLADLRRASRTLPLDEVLRGEEEGAADPASSDASSDPAARAADREEVALVGASVLRAMAGLTDREREAILGKYRDGLSQEEIGRRMGIGSPRVSRLLDAAHGKLGRAIRPEAGGDGSWTGLRDFLGVHLARSAPPGESTEEGVRPHG